MDKRIHLFIDNELDPEQKQAFEKDLLENKQMREDYEKMTGMIELAGKQYPRTSAPEGINDRIMAALEQEEQRSVMLHRFFRIAAALLIVVLTGSGIYMAEHRTSGLVSIQLSVALPDARTVQVLGSFNKWGGEPDRLKKAGNGLFTLTLKLKPGIYQYVYKVDDSRIVPDPHARLYTEDGFGQRNAVLIVHPAT